MVLETTTLDSEKNPVTTVPSSDKNPDDGDRVLSFNSRLVVIHVRQARIDFEWLCSYGFIFPPFLLTGAGFDNDFSVQKSGSLAIAWSDI